MPPGRTPSLVPESQFPGDALAQSVQKAPDPSIIGSSGNMVYTWIISSVADSITPWGRAPALRDRQLRDFWPTESFLAGALADITFRNSTYEWEIRGASNGVETLLTDMLKSAIAGDSFGWTNFALKFSLDLYTQDNGAFIELIRDPGVDANSRFTNERAPVLGIAHMDSNQCQRTGNPEYPVLYTDREGKVHKLAWYQVIPFSEFPSPIEKMNSVGYCGVTRALRLAQIMRSILLFKDEKISGRHFKAIHVVSGVSRMDLEDAKKRTSEDADNKGLQRYTDPVILASLDPEKPVSTATIDLAGLPEGFNFDQEMKWYITGLASCLGTDYQEFAPLPGGGIGSSNQSQTLNRKSSAKGPAMFMKIAEAFKNYGVLPRGYEMIFEDRDEQRSLDKQNVRKLFQEEMALALRNGFIPPGEARKIGIERGIYTAQELAGIPEEYGLDLLVPAKQPFGNTGGNTIAQDAGRTGGGPPEQNAGAGLRKEVVEEDITLKALLNKWFSRKEKDVPDINLTVNNHPGKAPSVVVHPTAMPAPKVTVNPSARVIVRPTAMPAPKVEVLVPTPHVSVNIEKQATPNVVVNNMVPVPSVEVKVPRARKEKQTITRDAEKNIKSTETNIEYEE